PVALGAMFSPRGRMLLLAAAVFLAPYFGNIGTRFLLPAAPFVALAMGLTLGRWAPLAAVILAAHAILSWPSVLKQYCEPRAWRLERIPIRQALRLEKEESYLNFKMPSYGVARMVERLTPPDAKVFTFSQ